MCYLSGITSCALTVCLSEGSGSVKAGGGGNAREIRIRKTKKKGRRDEDSDEETGPSQQSTLSSCFFFFLPTQGLDISMCTLSLFTEAFYCNKGCNGCLARKLSPELLSFFFFVIMEDKVKCRIPVRLISLCITFAKIAANKLKPPSWPRRRL